MPVPDTGSHPSSTAKTIASSGPSQKFGIEMPTSDERHRRVIDGSARGRRAATIPSGIAIDDGDDHRRDRQLGGVGQPLAGSPARPACRSETTCRDRRAPRRPGTRRTASAAAGRDRAGCAAPPRLRGDGALAEHRTAPDRPARDESARTPASRRRAAREWSAAVVARGTAPVDDVRTRVQSLHVAVLDARAA